METIMSHVNPAMTHLMLPLCFALFVLVACHARLMLGSWRSSLLMVFSGWFIAFAVEDFAIHLTGFYYFTEQMGPKLDVIPFSLPCLWVGFIYASWVVTNLVLDGSPMPKSYTWPRMIAGTVIGVLILTAIDFILDPIAVHNGYWVWVYEGQYFGVPAINYFVGWFNIGAITLLMHSAQLRLETIAPLEEKSRRVQIASLLPVLFYALIWVFFLAYNFEHILGLGALFSMGIPLSVAIWKWGLWYNEQGYGKNYEPAEKFSEQFVEGIREAKEKDE